MSRAGAARAAGLTLLEVAFALGLVVVILGAVFGSLASTLNVGVLTREHQAASEAASRQLDSFLTDPNLAFADATTWFDVEGKTGTPGAAPLFKPQSPLPPGWTEPRAGRVQVDVDPTGFGPGGLGPDCVAITVSVAWRASDGRNARVDLVALRAR